MGIEFFLALIIAVVVFVITYMKGDEVGNIIKSTGAVIVLGPIFFYFIIGMFGMLNADMGETQVIANNTITNIIDYITAKLPGILFADVAGAIVGGIGGTIVSAISGKK